MMIVVVVVHAVDLEDGIEEAEVVVVVEVGEGRNK